MYVHVQYRSDARYKANTFAFSCKYVCLLVLTMYKHVFASVYKLASSCKHV